MEEEKKKKNPYLFKKGQSGNPKGRPKKGQSFSDILDRELLRRKKELQIDGETRVVNGKELLALSLISIAFNSKTKDHEKMMAIEKIMERIDGKAMSKVDLSGSVETQKTASLVDMVDINSLSEKQQKTLGEILKNKCSDESL